MKLEDMNDVLATLVRWMSANLGGTTTIVVRTNGGIVVASSEDDPPAVLEAAGAHLRRLEVAVAAQADTEPPPGKAN